MKIMATNYCGLWLSLLRDQTNRGKIYNDFINERRALVKHLYRCRQCKNMIVALSPKVGIVPGHHMTDSEFAVAIRELWKLANSQKKQAP
jgi:hypothetical protein